MSYSLTFRDTIDMARNWLGGVADERSHIHIMQGILSGYRELTTFRKWSNYYHVERIYLHGAESTGTIAYDDSARELEIIGGTFPSWAADGEVRVGQVVAYVETRNSDSSLTLDSNMQFGDDIESGTDFTISQSSYTLPENFQSADTLACEESWWSAVQVEPRTWMANQRYDATTGPPAIWTIMGDRKLTNRLALYVNPAPSEDATLDLIIHRRPRELTHSGYEAFHSAGTVTCTSASYTITGTGTAFESSMVGSTLRIGRDGVSIPGPRVGPDPYWFEARITAVGSATSLTIEELTTAAVVGRKYVISDPVDIDPGMTEAFLRCCEKNIGIQRRAENIRELDALFTDAMYTAAANDAKSFSPRVVGQNNAGFARRLSSFPAGADQA